MDEIRSAFTGLDWKSATQRGVLAAANVDKLFRSAGRATEVDVSIDIQYNPDPGKLYRRFEEGTQLSDAEVGVLVRSGNLDGEDFKKLQDSMVFFGVFGGGKGYSEQ